MKKWYDEEYEFEIEVTGFLRGEHTERYCRNGEEIGDKYRCTYGCPVNAEGQGICSKVMTVLFPIMEAVRSGGDLENIGGDGKYSKNIVCPDGCVMFRLTAKKTGNENFFKGKFFHHMDAGQVPHIHFVQIILVRLCPIQIDVYKRQIRSKITEVEAMSRLPRMASARPAKGS